MRLIAIHMFSVIFAVSLHAVSDEYDLVIENGRIVGGGIIIEKIEHTGARPGQVLYGLGK